ncbi:MAG: VanZ family protein, partial [Candidatus Latescibacteria bacterium]|nr:VanZ family protein [Candidatus Latescibacterota bacterium]
GSHMVEYAILVYLWFRSLCVVRERFARSVVLSVILSVLYAASDEWHQSFVPSRDGTVTDVIWDASGAVLMAIFLWYIYQRGTGTVKRTVLG